MKNKIKLIKAYKKLIFVLDKNRISIYNQAYRLDKTIVGYHPRKYTDWKDKMYIYLGNVPEIIFNNDNIKLTIRNICHEIGHYLAVPPQRRRRKDYGIPSGDAFTNLSNRAQMKYDIEELKAQLLEHEVMVRLGLYKSDSRLHFRADSLLLSDDLLPNRKKKLKEWFDTTGKNLVKEFMTAV